MPPKRKRLFIIVGIIGGLFLLMIIGGIISASKKTDEHNAKLAENRDEVVASTKVALAEKNFVKLKGIKESYGYADDAELKQLLRDFENLEREAERATKEKEKALAAQEKANAQVATLNNPVSDDTLAVTITKVTSLDNVGTWLFNEKALKGVKYIAIDYSYKNISKTPTHAQPELVIMSPDGSIHTEDISAGAAYASSSDDYDEEIFSQLNPQVHSNGVAVFKVPESMLSESGWKLSISLGDIGLFSTTKFFYLKLN
jgi:hypothetical protein